MSLWRLEWLRLVRTRRLLVLGAGFALFGLAGPLTARYLGDLLKHAGGQVQIVVPPPSAADGITTFLQSADQLGVIITVVVAAAALSLDAVPALATFYRTRATRWWELVLPRYLVTTAAVLGCVLAGTAAAWYETTVVIGALPADRMLFGAFLECLYFAFVTATVALAAAVARGILATIGITLVILVGLPLAGGTPGFHSWLPSTLADGLSDALVASPRSFAMPILSTVVFTFIVLILATAGINRRQT